MLLEMYKNTDFPLVNMEMEAFEQALSLQKDFFVKIPVIGTVVYNFIKENEMLQPNIFIYFKAIFNVIENNDCQVRWRWHILCLRSIIYINLGPSPKKSYISEI